jgi:hypothetical protein
LSKTGFNLVHIPAERRRIVRFLLRLWSPMLPFATDLAGQHVAEGRADGQRIDLRSKLR